MGNCQAAEVAAVVVVQHPGNRKIDRMYWTISAHDVMNSNPGYYVALVLHSSSSTTNNNNYINNTKEQPSLKLLKPTDTLHLGHLYRLISFEDVIKEFAAKKSVKFGKLLKVDSGAARSTFHHNQEGIGSSISRSTGSRRLGRHHGGAGQWKPVLHSVAELEG